MSASQGRKPAWPDPIFWDHLDRLEARHQRVQMDHDSARRGLEKLTPPEVDELRAAWHRYCEVIAELDRTTAEIEALRG